MYLTQILEVDLNWLSEGWEERMQDEELDWEDDDKCLGETSVVNSSISGIRLVCSARSRS